MDLESPEHLERLRAVPAIKAVCLVHRPEPGSATARFERAPRNHHYWAPIEALVDRLLTQGWVEDLCMPQTFYDQPCSLLAISLKPGSAAPFAVAVVAEPPEPLYRQTIRDVTRDYWFGSTFFK